MSKIKKYYLNICKVGKSSIQKRFIKDIQDPRYKATRLGLLDTMMHFVNTCTCRKKMLLSYFGDKSVKERCEMCDNCLNGVKEKSQQTKMDMRSVLRF